MPFEGALPLSTIVPLILGKGLELGKRCMGAFDSPSTSLPLSVLHCAKTGTNGQVLRLLLQRSQVLSEIYGNPIIFKIHVPEFFFLTKDRFILNEEDLKVIEEWKISHYYRIIHTFLKSNRTNDLFIPDNINSWKNVGVIYCFNLIYTKGKKYPTEIFSTMYTSEFQITYRKWLHFVLKGFRNNRKLYTYNG